MVSLFSTLPIRKASASLARTTTGATAPKLIRASMMRRSSSNAVIAATLTTLIAWAFDSMRRYYKDHGRQLAYYIREYISDGRLARVSTPTGHRYIPLIKDEMTMEFDVIVDEAPTSANVKERVWAVLEVMLPNLIKMGFPIPPEVLDFSPLPSDLAEKWKEKLTQGPTPEQKKAQEIEIRDKMAEIMKDESSAELNKAKAEETRANITKIGAEAGRIASGN